MQLRKKNQTFAIVKGDKVGFSFTKSSAGEAEEAGQPSPAYSTHNLSAAADPGRTGFMHNSFGPCIELRNKMCLRRAEGLSTKKKIFSKKLKKRLRRPL